MVICALIKWKYCFIYFNMELHISNVERQRSLDDTGHFLVGKQSLLVTAYIFSDINLSKFITFTPCEERDCYKISSAMLCNSNNNSHNLGSVLKDKHIETNINTLLPRCAILFQPPRMDMLTMGRANFMNIFDDGRLAHR